MPKLFIHSNQDEQVPFKEGELVYNNALFPKTFFVYEGNHLQAMKVNPIGVLRAIDRWMNYTIKKKYSIPTPIK